MKKLVLLLITFWAYEAFAQVTPRNILAQKYSPERVKQALVARGQYHPYPTTPTEWQKGGA